jgi:hypothetical protein
MKRIPTASEEHVLKGLVWESMKQLVANAKQGILGSKPRRKLQILKRIQDEVFS